MLSEQHRHRGTTSLTASGSALSPRIQGKDCTGVGRSLTAVTGLPVRFYRPWRVVLLRRAFFRKLTGDGRVKADMSMVPETPPGWLTHGHARRSIRPINRPSGA